MDNIMMASAGRGGAGLRGDQYYPPPPPPPFPRLCVSLSLSLSLSLSVSPCLSTPTTNLPSDSPSSFPCGAATIAISTLRMSGFSPFYRLPQPPLLARPSVSLFPPSSCKGCEFARIHANISHGMNEIVNLNAEKNVKKLHATSRDLYFWCLRVVMVLENFLRFITNVV